MTLSALDYLLVDVGENVSSAEYSETRSLQTVLEDSELLDDNFQSGVLQHQASAPQLTFSSSASIYEADRVAAYSDFLGLEAITDTKLARGQLDQSIACLPPCAGERIGVFSEFSHTEFSDHGLFSVNDLPPHKDEAQVMLDVKRLFTEMCQYHSFNVGGQSSYTTILTTEDIDILRKRLYCLVIRVLRKYPTLNYYQGYHDIASVVLLVCDEGRESSDENAFCILEALTINHLRDYMIQDISLTTNHLKLIPLLIENTEPVLFELLKHANNNYIATDGMYYDYKFLPALLSILTLFSHDLTNGNLLLLAWDFILGHGSITASVYIYAAILIHYKSIILDELGLEDNCDFENIDSDLAHSLLSPASLFSNLNESTFIEVLQSAAELIQYHDLECLPNSSETFDIWFKNFNSDSVIMTSSRLRRVPYLRGLVSQTPNPDEIKALIATQESQQQGELLHEAGLLQKAFDQVDSLATLVNSEFGDAESSRLSLVSSFMSLKAVSSSLNETLINSPSNFLKKITSLEGDGDRNRHWPKINLGLSIYKLSLTIGFLGFILHFLVKQSEFGALFKLSTKSAFQTAARYVETFGETNFIRVVNRLSSAVTNIKELGPVKDLADITQVGLGSIKRSIYTMGFQQ
ncbi:hypothetical protein METBIDRAFT_13539 [Metschnikowia bicuspidata var. bicuspidata NRRL YB-4993]|uniref:Rab-GAP TBC domain-containing protein n=1 Tax=Metschnikowia bicuspidata var. bicuspidata NRRL YB-4993 TaxID=869754 RepID=A0A1A0H5C4_9ASCO|nr:hypothetical protein METBIDRAFT_13539 [Metschnikowia bicuspidata var. bicuspidata NRRL YB-4993]OBA19236.1 hypothetical protein METBIDRAFT_13539 [Metschnikowia bicuspidata var. bicuspidata NRRL YB-4993]